MRMQKRTTVTQQRRSLHLPQAGKIISGTNVPRRPLNQPSRTKHRNTNPSPKTCQLQSFNNSPRANNNSSPADDSPPTNNNSPPVGNSPAQPTATHTHEQKHHRHEKINVRLHQSPQETRRGRNSSTLQTEGVITRCLPGTSSLDLKKIVGCPKVVTRRTNGRKDGISTHDLKTRACPISL